MVGQPRALLPWAFVAPAVLVLFAIAGWPLLRTFILSLTDASLANLDSERFVGLSNYGELLTDAEWWLSVRNTLGFTVISVFLETVLGTVIALVIHRKFWGRGVVRTAILVPWAIPAVVSARIWAWMLNDSFGIVNRVLMDAGLVSAPIAWLAADTLSFAAVVLVDVWKTTPFMALLVLAALQAVPGSLREVAKLDGIRPWRFFWKVTLPYIRPALLVAVIFRTLDALRVFDVIYVLTGANRAVMSMSIYAREQLIDFQGFGYGSAACVMVFLVVGIVIALYLRMAGKELVR